MKRIDDIVDAEIEPVIIVDIIAPGLLPVEIGRVGQDILPL